MKIRHINRRASQKMRGRRSWCPSCDRSLVSNGKKCVVCGKRNCHGVYLLNVLRLI